MSKERPETWRARALRTKGLALEKISGEDVPRCVYCECDDIRLLQINHKNGGGYHEARKDCRYGLVLYRAIVNGKRRTDDLEVVCPPHNILHYLGLKLGQAAIGGLTIRWRPSLP